MLTLLQKPTRREEEDSTHFQGAAAGRKRLVLSGSPYRLCSYILAGLPAPFHVSQGLGGAVAAAAVWTGSRRSHGSFPAPTPRSQVAAWAPSLGVAAVAQGRRAAAWGDAGPLTRPRRRAVGAGSWAAAPGAVGPGSAPLGAWHCVDGGWGGVAGAQPRGTRHGGGVPRFCSVFARGPPSWSRSDCVMLAITAP